MFPYVNDGLSGIRTRCSSVMRKKNIRTLENRSWRGNFVQSMKGRMRKRGVKTVRVHLLSFSSVVARLFGARGQ